MKQIASITAALTLTIAAAAAAQDTFGSGAPDPVLRPGWVFTPSLGVSETYDDNITLFGNLEPLNNNDLVSSVGPDASLTYYGRHTRFSTGYGASFLNYRTFSVFDRWNQHAEAEFRRQQNARFEWFGQANGQAVPSTETLEYNGIPFVHTGAVTFDARGGATYKIDSRNSISSALQYQHVTFDVQGDAYRRYLRGGWAATSTNNYRRQLDERVSLGADYVFVRSQVRNDIDLADTHTIQAALDYAISSRWRFTGAAGVAVLPATAVTPGQMAPAFRAALDQNDRGRRFRLAYMQGVLPAFGLGGSQNTKEVTVSYRTPLFGSRHFFTDQSASYRDSTPVVPILDALELRSLRTFSTVGWMPQRWVRVEAFYTHLSQSSLVAGGRLDRNRIGFQITTSKPMRID